MRGECILALTAMCFAAINTEDIPDQLSSTTIPLFSSTEAKIVSPYLAAETKTSSLAVNFPRTTSEHEEKAESVIGDISQSEICKRCRCQEGITFVVNCQGKDLAEPFLYSDWPLSVLTSNIEVTFDDNYFTEISQFPELPIVKLSYQSNGIEIIQRAAFKFLKNLDYLDLSQNNLTHESLGGNVFEGPFSEQDDEPIPLRTLKLGYNKITSLDKDAFNHISSHLEILELNNNPLKVIDHQTAIAITTLRKLKTLNLAETNLASIPNGVFHALPALKLLILSGNELTEVPGDLQHAIHLEFLNLNSNPIKFLDATSFLGLSHLKTLNISSMPYLKHIDSNTFTPLSSMSNLWCSFNPALRVIHPRAFNNMQITDETLQLIEIHFRGNNMTNFPSCLLPWTSLDVIDISDNPFVCDCKLGWLVGNLLPSILEKTPEYTWRMSCASPEEYKDFRLNSFKGDEKMFNCSNSINDDAIDDDHTELKNDSNSSQKGIIIISLFGIISVIGGLTCFVILAVKKSHLRQLYDSSTGQIVHYVRTGSGKCEDEQAIVDKEYSQYHEEP